LPRRSKNFAPPPPPPPNEKTIVINKGDQTEIVIRQKGNKDSKLTLEIKNGDFLLTVNHWKNSMMRISSLKKGKLVKMIWNFR
jgi:hypothetical protein